MPMSSRVRATLRRFRMAAKTIYSYNPVIARAMDLLIVGRVAPANELLRTTRLNLPYSDVSKLRSELDYAIKTNEMLRISDIYSDEFVTSLWTRYRAQFQESPQYSSEAWFCQTGADMISEAVATAQPSSLIDFGCMCGEMDHRIAINCPTVKLWGSDRQSIIKELNESAYYAPNLSFHAGDIFELIASAPKSALFHVRTTVLLYPAFVQELYHACRRAGIETIIVFEPCGISRQTGLFPDYADLPQSVVFRSNMFLHNYRALLGNAGYSVIDDRRIPIGVRYFDDPGFHMTWLVGRLA